MHDAAVKLWPQ